MDPDIYNNYYDSMRNTQTDQDAFTKLQQEEIYERNTPEKLPELNPIATGQSARGTVRNSDEVDNATTLESSSKRKR